MKLNAEQIEYLLDAGFICEITDDKLAKGYALCEGITMDDVREELAVVAF